MHERLPNGRNVTTKSCRECGEQFRGGTRAIRCVKCQKAFIKSSSYVYRRTAYYGKNKEKTARQKKAYRLFYTKTPRGRLISQNEYHRRRSLLKGAGGAHTVNQWLELCIRCDGRCQMCWEKKKLTRDHIVPLTKGGSNDITNIQPLCLLCNIKKGNRPWELYKPTPLEALQKLSEQLNQK